MFNKSIAIHSIEICIYSHDGCVHTSGHTHSLLVTNQELPVTFKVVEIYTMYTELNNVYIEFVQLFTLDTDNTSTGGLSMKPFETFTKAKINFTLGAVIRLDWGERSEPHTCG